MSRHALWTLVAIVAVELGLVGAGGAYYVLSQTGGVNGPAVVASFYPYQFLASRVAGDRFAVSALVPPGVEPHDWEPTPRDVLTIGTAAKLRQDLARIDGLFAAGLQTCARRVFITQHEAFAYLAARYNLTQVAIQGLSPDQEPTPAKVQEILNVINATGSKVVFFEELVNPAVAQTLAHEAKVQTMVLSPIEGLTAEERANGDTYLSLMEMNLQNLRIALECA